MSPSSKECVITHLNNLRDLLKEGYTQQALSKLSSLEGSLTDYIEHIDYSEHELPA
jgi:hypothetical protein